MQIEIAIDFNVYMSYVDVTTLKTRKKNKNKNRKKRKQGEEKTSKWYKCEFPYFMTRIDSTKVFYLFISIYRHVSLLLNFHSDNFSFRPYANVFYLACKI